METKRERFNKRLAQMKGERDSFDSHWKELSEYIAPRTSRFLGDDDNKGGKKNDKIINNTATLAARTLESGMMSGLTSPSRPWFKLTVSNPAMMEYGPVKTWLWFCEQMMRDVFAKSNLYNILMKMYESLGIYGTGALGVFEDEDNGIHCYAFPVGSYYIAVSYKGVVDTLYREYKMTVRQLVQQFGIENVSQTVKSLYENNTLEQQVEVVHVIEPNMEREKGRLDAKNKPFISVYYEKSGTDGLLRESGFDDFPVMAPRWDLTCGEDVYGSSPGMEALGDIKVLQKYQERCYDLISKGANPPLLAPTELRMSGGINALPGQITYVNANEIRSGVIPLYTPDPNWIGVIGADAREHEQRIDRTFYKDIFMMLANDTRSNVTATEINERREEKMLMLGPVVERLENELLTPLVERTFHLLNKQGRLPPPPPEIEAEEMKVEYISVISQAQKAVATVGIERVLGFVGNIAGINQEVVDKIDFDQAIDEYSMMTGVTPTIVRSDEDVQALREQRAQQQQAAQAQAEMQQGVQSAKLLSETDMGGDNALAALVQGAGGV